VPAPRRWRRVLPATVAVVCAAALVYFAIDKFWVSKHLTSPPPPPAAPGSVASAAFAPPPHSIAVLPFVNIGGEKEQEYFSDGLTEELLNSLARVNELQVSGRTSSFYFKGKDVDLGTIARKLNVSAVLEGSVRRSAHTVRITAQLVNAVTGFHLWSETYDRDLGDVLKLQSEIANAVAGALKVTLLGDVSTKIELGGTRDPAAFDAYLRGSRALNSMQGGEDLQKAIAEYSEAIRLDSSYVLAFAGRSSALSAYAQQWAAGPAVREDFARAEADARHAIALAPELAEAHVALAHFLASGSLDYSQASDEYQRAVALSPGNAEAQGEYGRFAVAMGHSEAGIAAARRAVALDPLGGRKHYLLAGALFYARHYDESLRAFQEFVSLNPDSQYAYAFRGIAYYALGDFQNARSSCEVTTGQWNQLCLALAYDKLARHADAEAVLEKYRTAFGDDAAYQYAEIYAQWGNAAKALEWLETALRLRDSGLVFTKTDPLLDPLRKEPRFQAIERELKFPN
jgi:TolB-like protein/Tfp pilus assembly protein PilF